MTVTTTCQTCRREYDVSLEDLRRGIATWTRCPQCREAKGQENRTKLRQAIRNRAAHDAEIRGEA